MKKKVDVFSLVKRSHVVIVRDHKRREIRSYIRGVGNGGLVGGDQGVNLA